MTKRLSDRQRLWLLGLLLAATWLYTWGLQRNLPYGTEADESVFVDRAVIMATSGDLHPHWFGHPGSTIFYPLVAIYRIWYLWSRPAAPDIASWFAAEAWSFYYLGRLLSVAYTLLTLPLLYQVGRRLFNTATGLIGIVMVLSYPIMLLQIKTVRSDGVGCFFALLAFWVCLKLHAQPRLRTHLLAGIVIGLGISSRYFLVLFTLFFLWASWWAWRNHKASLPWRSYWPMPMAGLLAIGVSFALSTPYFVLDFPAAWQGLIVEGRSTHPGADGLSRIQNFFWYFDQIGRTQFQAVQSGFAIIGLLAIARERRLLQLGLVGTIVIFLAGISASPLHWLRWALPILPLAALISAHGLITVLTDLTQNRLKILFQPLLVILIVAAVAIPGLRSVQFSIRDASRSTQLLARQWLLDHLPTDARLIQEPYTALLAEDPRVTTTGLSLGTDHTLADYQREGYTHLVISSYMYSRFLAEPTRYPSEVAFYQSLLERRTPLVTFSTTWAQGGPNLHIYALSTVKTGN